MKRKVGIIALALVTVSCGGSASSESTNAAAATQPSPTSSTGSVAEGSYESVRALQLDVEAAFYLCSAPMKIYDPPLSEDALAQADCSKDIGLLIYEPNDVQTNAAEILANADGISVLLVGDNWIITCSSDEATCERIQGVTGGELIISTS